ncbi:UDP-N-acetylmuramate dehydrogenase [Clostridium cylindrosporum]|uniref:UDP-N-acetylenolpyruvoylglucosamine reductase n=1 Tax=Clostridium cylindrosporum DSM 605 TaxID=1121307 RepID=A0A0J8FZT9_CLOCY|nr:UDP-N-acetylmuramate dehydrogenase [Clostridium cylindrosporum]KMT21071.1 UDP-N-acetylenolpyruvoylglucosamine reductase MurB [Clostridium cylindrosporum DSM 605]
MNINEFKVELEKRLNKDIVKYEEPLKHHTSFKLGGPCSALISPTTKDEVVVLIKLCREFKVPFFILGNGSNLIVKDGGFKGIIIQLTSLKNISLDNKKITVESGATLAMTANFALKNCLKGMEFASGIPGTVGGAITMNAGAYGGEIKDIIESAKVVTLDGDIIELTKDELDLSYRSSVIQRNNYIVLEATFSLEDGEKEEIKALMDDFNGRRRDKQPLNYPSAGSTFKRPPGHFAGKLIEDAGLKGFGIGGAKVSEKHAGFVINYDNASANDVIALISKVQEKINEEYGILLETEVKIIGED